MSIDILDWQNGCGYTGYKLITDTTEIPKRFTIEEKALVDMFATEKIIFLDQTNKLIL